MIATVRAPTPPVAKTGRDYVSFTELTTYQRCPLKWHFQYVEQRPREVIGASLAFGSAVHAAIEMHFRALLAGLPAPSTAELLTAYDRAWKDEATATVRFAKGDSAGRLRGLAQQILETFQASPVASPDGEILGVEEELRHRLIPGLPEVLARIDLMVRSRNALQIVDFKTARSRWTADNVTEAAPQLLLYGELATPLAEEFGDLPVQLRFVVLTKTKTTAIDTHVVAADPAAIGRTKRLMQRLWHATRAGHVYPNPSALNCSACPFLKACRNWRG